MTRAELAAGPIALSGARSWRGPTFSADSRSGGSQRRWVVTTYCVEKVGVIGELLVNSSISSSEDALSGSEDEDGTVA